MHTNTSTTSCDVRADDAPGNGSEDLEPITPEAWREQFEQTWQYMVDVGRAWSIARAEPVNVERAQFGSGSRGAAASVDFTPVSLLYYSPGALYKLVAGRPSVEFASDAPRRVVTWTWEHLQRWLSRFVEGTPIRYYDAKGCFVVGTEPDMVKRARGAWAPGVYRLGVGHEDLARDFVSTNILVVDVDGGDPYAVAVALAAYASIVHSTYTHGVACKKNPQGGPRCRSVILLSRNLMTKSHYDAVLGAVASYLASLGFVCKASDSKLGKLAFLPMHSPNISPVFLTTKGKPLDVDSILGEAERERRIERERQERERAARRGSRPTRTGDDDGCSAAVAHVRGKVRDLCRGERHEGLKSWLRWLAGVGASERDVIDVAVSIADDEREQAEFAALAQWAVKAAGEAGER